MPVSFSDAALRHRSDAKHLASDSRFQNAGHLIGFAAECLVKCYLVKGGIQIDQHSGLRVHFPHLTQAIIRNGHGRLMKLLLPIVTTSSFLAGWTAELRYENALSAASAHVKWKQWIADVELLFKAAGIP